jgi:hypothetical protein
MQESLLEIQGLEPVMIQSLLWPGGAHKAVMIDRIGSYAIMPQD